MHVPFYIENLIKDKETNFQDFFNLEKLPDNIKELKKSSNLIKDMRYDISDIISDAKDLTKSCERDCLTKAIKTSEEMESKVCNMEYYVDELEKVIEHWQYAYDSLLSLTTEIINKEKIDLESYSTNITEKELNAYRRITKINKMLGN